MEDDLEMYFDSTGSFLESIIKSRKHLDGKLLNKLDELIDAELDLAIMGAAKAKSEILKKDTDNKIRPIK